MANQTSSTRNDHDNGARRDFLKTTAAGVASVAACSGGIVRAAESTVKSPESLVKVLYDTLSAKQKELLCFDWNYMDPKRGLLRTRVANNWHITAPIINKKEDFTDEQRDIIRKIFEGLIVPEWHAKFDEQLEDDCGGFGEEQNIAIFGKPGEGKFEFVMTGRHMTMRCDGNSEQNVAFGGPIFYGHAPTGNTDPDNHEGNVFWPQAVEANKVYTMLDGKQRKLAEVSPTAKEQDVAFRGKDGRFMGIPATDLSRDQREQLQKTLQSLMVMYRQSDTEEALACLKAQGGLDACYLAFFTDVDLGNNKIWDIWRLEGPSFVWHFRGAPHVHVWVNIADNPSVKLNA